MNNINRDYFTFINEKWLLNTKIPDDDIVYSNAKELQLKVNHNLKQIILSNIFTPAKVLYDSFNNTKYREHNSISEIQTIIDILNMVNSFDDLIKIATLYYTIGINTIFSLNIQPDANNKFILFIQKPYLNINKNNIEEYTSYTNTIFDLFYKKTYDISLEIDLIKISEYTDKQKINYDKYSFLKLIILNLKKILNIDFSINEIYINDLYFFYLNTLLMTYSIAQWKEYFKMCVINTFINISTNKLIDIFNLSKKIFKKKDIGIESVLYTVDNFDEIISIIYNNNFLDLQIKSYVSIMIQNIIVVVNEKINNITWLTDEIKLKLIKDITNMKIILGYNNFSLKKYPDITSHSIIQNKLILNYYDTFFNIKKLTRKFNDNQPCVNSYHVHSFYCNIPFNQLILSTAILQPPFVDLKKSFNYNYANIGVIISHMILHNLNNNLFFYTNNDLLKTMKNNSSSILEKDKLCINIKIENLIDILSLSITLDALKNSSIITLDDIKDFFKEYIISKRILVRNSFIDQRVKLEPHEYTKDRVNISLDNNETFKQIYNLI